MNEYKDKSTTITALYGASVAIHIFLSCYFAWRQNLYLLGGPSELLASIYRSLGFAWDPAVAPIVSGSFILALILNIARRFTEGLLLGWPRFSAHDKSTMPRALLRSITYLFLSFIALGALGMNTAKISGFADVIFIAIGTYILGVIVNVIDDAISSVYVTIKGT